MVWCGETHLSDALRKIRIPSDKWSQIIRNVVYWYGRKTSCFIQNYINAFIVFKMKALFL